MGKKFLCDQMCSELGRWLRTAGYDTAIATGSLSDRQILQEAMREHRLLLTRDKHFKELDPESKTTLHLKGEFLEDWAEQMKRECGLDWYYRPFSRCLKCNGLLEKTSPSSDIPDRVRESAKEFWRCPHCHQIFWLGSHTDRMAEQLKKWKEGPLCA